jgi:hypothetical protein
MWAWTHQYHQPRRNVSYITQSIYHAALTEMKQLPQIPCARCQPRTAPTTYTTSCKARRPHAVIGIIECVNGLADHALLIVCSRTGIEGIDLVDSIAKAAVDLSSQELTAHDVSIGNVPYATMLCISAKSDEYASAPRIDMLTSLRETHRPMELVRTRIEIGFRSETMTQTLEK